MIHTTRKYVFDFTGENLDKIQFEKRLRRWFDKSSLDEIVDEMFRQIAMFLDVYPPLEKIKVKTLFHEWSGAEDRAYYRHDAKTIYIYTRQATREIFCHESVHAILHAVLGVRLPAVADEHLAKWVTEKVLRKI